VLRKLPNAGCEREGGQETYAPGSHQVAMEGQSGLRTIYDTLFRSRLGMPAIASGLCRRLSDEAVTRTARRATFGRPQADYDQVQFRLATLGGMAELNRRLWQFTGVWMDDHPDVSGDYALVNAAKIVSSETLQAAADSALQLFASAGYKRTHLVGRAYVDSRPFQIFEGTNDVLNVNTYDAIASRHGSSDRAAIAEEFRQYGLRLPEELPPSTLALVDASRAQSQREKVNCGHALAWMLALSILQLPGDHGGSALEEAQRVVKKRIAELAAAMPYLG